MKILKIVPDTVVDGPGLRTSIYFAGCKVHCEGCHNPTSWNFQSGIEYSTEEVIQKIEEFGNKRITLTGGNPLDQENLFQLASLCLQLKDKNYNIWLYSGYTYEQIRDQMNPENMFKFCLLFLILKSIDVLVDGPFILKQKDTNLLYRGSSNQRLIDMHQSSDDKIVLFKCE